MGKHIRTVLVPLLALVFVGSCAAALWQAAQYRMGDRDYEQAEQLVALPDLTELPPPAQQPQQPAALPSPPPASDSSSAPEPEQQAPAVYVDPYADALRAMDFTALRQVNDDVLGWILIPNTRLSYPLLQGEDNEYYLNRTWKKSRNSVGAIFMECRSSPDLSDFNTIIYGHRMNDRSMFGILRSYEKQSYWEDHPCIYITDDSGSHTYEVFAAYEVAVTADTYRLVFRDEGEKQAFLDFCLSQSVIDTGVVPNVWDRILTLSTCTGNGHDTRWVVQAVIRGEPPAQPQPEDLSPEEEGAAAEGTQPQEAPPSQDIPSQDIPSQDIRKEA